MVSFKLSSIIAVTAFFAQNTVAAPSPSITSSNSYVKRAASCTFPSPPQTSVLSAPKVVSGTFDGGNVRYNRGAGACQAQPDVGRENAVFILENGATLKNVVIGANQVEGIRCMGACTIENVWFEDVCETAITVGQTSGTTNIIGGGAKSAIETVVLHNGGGTVNIDSYCVRDFGRLYRSCNNCSTQYKRTVNIRNIIANNGKLLAGVNSNYGDVATLENNQVTAVSSICDTFKGNNVGNESVKLTSNTPNENCKF